MPIMTAAAALFGLAVGSFLNVVIHRVPAGLSLVRPASSCPNCHHAIRARHNVPVLGWIMLHGRCADCSAPISVRYPLVELVTGLLFVGTTATVVHEHHLAALPAYLFFVSIGIALAAIDLDVMRLPNAIVYPSYAVLGALLTLASIIDGSYDRLLRAAAGAVVLPVLFLALALAKPGGMGLGDVKFSGILGAILGFISISAIVIGVFAAFLLGGVVATALLATRQADRSTPLPFGPALIGGAFIAIFAAAPIAHAYSHLSHQV